MNVNELREYRTKLYEDVYSGIIPDRFPVHDGLSPEYLIEYAGKDFMTTQYQYTEELLEEIGEKAMELVRGDSFSMAWVRNPIAIMFQKSKAFVMSKTGMIQHPEVSGFEADEYDEFIKNPFEFMVEKIIPRLNPGLDTDPIARSVNFTRIVLAQMDQQEAFDKSNQKLVEKYGFFSPPPGTMGLQLVPFDFLADFCRGFTKIVVDIKRQPEKVLEAMEALMPYAIWAGRTPETSIFGANMIMTHMATFLNTKDFEKFYWPTFYKLCHICAERGQAMSIFCEDDWTRYIDYLQELPQGTRLAMEYGDPVKFKDKLGKKMVLSGFYPISLLKTGTKQQCIDKAKELIDILAPGGNYIFGFDKQALSITDINPENYVAVMEYVLANSKYTNAGKKVTTAKKEDSVIKFSQSYPEFKSKYIVSYEEFISDYPPVCEKVDPLMRKAYNKYTDMVIPYLSSIL
ncbi:uroporphyrinogen decarboxylase family protein [Tepidanaerobacter syntrophicus]|uniref:Uroporphyrinogen decarboxylase n=1 Tax=Tepidanaerobacter syntrophicus TaxID=224999 RepID=A0A0U9HCH0_9FIRM|nr:uroporphyrinogen decarboxylase family protein [Tepidanaerobacter syntrophicus]GAQ24166.1 uroporphyrinogen decarboxylase [Tepidanaerobacter syntrophicus]